MSQPIIKVLAALAQDHRLATYRMLVVAGREGLSAGTIAERLGLVPSSLSFHLSQLINAGLVTQRRDGRRIIYAPDYEALAGVVRFLTDNCCEGQGCGVVPGCGDVPLPECMDEDAASRCGG